MVINKEIICLTAFLVVGIILVCMLSTRTEGMTLNNLVKMNERYQAATGRSCGNTEQYQNTKNKRA